MSLQTIKSSSRLRSAAIHDPYSEEEEGDVGKIMDAMGKWFKRVASDRLKEAKEPKKTKKKKS